MKPEVSQCQMHTPKSEPRRGDFPVIRHGEHGLSGDCSLYFFDSAFDNTGNSRLIT